MKETAIKVESISKEYTIGGTVRSDTLRDWLVSIGKEFRSVTTGKTIWALNDVSFDVERGEVLGMIGANGAGKSTLLKILSRITEPTAGRAVIEGRVGSLLEVGTGFHPELTGRENIFLGGAVLGMTKNEISRKLDEIVEFSGIGKMLDTPVKRYSSGMKVRLGFAVAAHLQPEILLVDEVLAVGDVAFQHKCLGKINEIVHGGRTVVFVSHNMAAIQNMCNRVVLLVNGQVSEIGDADSVVERYLAGSDSEIISEDFRQHPGRTPGSVPIVAGLSIRTLADTLTNERLVRKYEINVELNPPYHLARPVIGLTVEDAQGRRICSFATHFSRVELPEIRGKARVTCTIPDLPLLSGKYYLNVGVGLPHETLIDAIYRAISFKIDPGKDEADILMSAGSHGPIRLPALWKLNQD